MSAELAPIPTPVLFEGLDLESFVPPAMLERAARAIATPLRTEAQQVIVERLLVDVRNVIRQGVAAAIADGRLPPDNRPELAWTVEVAALRCAVKVLAQANARQAAWLP
jgi:hypothetical protein